MNKAYEVLENYIKEYKNNWKNTLNDMEEHYDNADELWWVIEQLMDKIVELQGNENE